jgi:predicted ATPase/class 3 adenylate cyclase/Flp pilus assembly protein TadD
MNHVRALLLTDVVDSTRLSLRVGDTQMVQLWAVHDRAARDLLPVWRGREIDKTDGMLLLFDVAADAVGYALAYQQALNRLAPQLRARAGLHVGPVTLRRNSAADIAQGAKPIEVEGVAKATAARVMAVAQGGQLLLSADARRQLGEGAWQCHSHGHWRLKGLDDPIELFEVTGPGSPVTPPPDGEKGYRIVQRGGQWLPRREIANTLPAERDGFVGRREALADLARRFRADARLVSVLGIGGTGKTRLAVRFGWDWLGDFPGGVWFCDLTTARTLAGVADCVAQGLDIPLGREDPVLQIGRAIAGRGSCLVIVDNFEQVARMGAQTLGRWLDMATEARFVVTTREVLGLPGEQVLPLLPLPPAEGTTLLLQRAAAVKPDSALTDEDLAACTSLVSLLDGLPLAIELAAARMRVMSPPALLQRMGQRFQLLTSRGNRLDRQATLRAAFDWSWDLLTASEKAALAQLSVFEGGFTLEAAEGMLDLAGSGDEVWTVDVVNSLVDKSFVRARSDGRFDLLVSVQVYAAEHLETEGRFPGSGAQALLAAQRRHAAWFAAFGPRRVLEAGGVELDNLVAACQRSVSSGDGDSAAGALDGAWAALWVRGPYEVGVTLAESVCAMPALGDRAAAIAQTVAADALRFCGRMTDAGPLLEQALVCARTSRDRHCEARVLVRMGALLDDLGRLDEARSRHLDANRLARELGDPYLQCQVLNGLGGVDLVQGRMSSALSLYSEALALWRTMGNRLMEGMVLGNIANVHDDLGQSEEALALREEALAIARECGDRRGEGIMLCNLGCMHLAGRFDESAAVLQAALANARELGNVNIEGLVRSNLGIAFEHLGRRDEAMTQFESAVQVAHLLRDPLDEGVFLSYLGRFQARQGRLEDAQGSLAAGEALLRPLSERLGLGTLLCAKAEMLHLAADRAGASAALDEARDIMAEVAAGASSRLGNEITRLTLLFGVRGA